MPLDLESLPRGCAAPCRLMRDLAKEIQDIMRTNGFADLPLDIDIDIVEPPLLREFEKLGVDARDPQQVMPERRGLRDGELRPAELLPRSVRGRPDRGIPLPLEFMELAVLSAKALRRGRRRTTNTSPQASLRRARWRGRIL